MTDDADGRNLSEGVESADRYQKVFEHSNDAILIVDLGSESFLDANPAASELLGYSHTELLDMAPRDIHPNDMDRVREEFISDVAASGSGFTDELTCLTKDGQKVLTEVSGAALNDADTVSELTMIAILHDISDRVRQRRELEAQVERFQQFADILSHDLRTPLQVISGQAELIESSVDPAEIQPIYDAVDWIERLSDDLLRLVESGNVIGEQAPHDLEQLCRAAWPAIETEAATLTIESTATIRADGGRVQDLLRNLFENAADHCTDGVTVRVGALESETGFYVADDGPGIPADERADAFNWGYSTDMDGTGLGLAIVEQVATAHGWTVDVVESEAGGARFEFTGVATA